MISIYEHLRRLASRMILAFHTPKQVISLMKIFTKLFMDDDNFVPYSEWGKDTSPFTLSAKGLQKVESLAAQPDFKEVYRSGTAGMKKPYDLLYFLTQTLVLLPTALDSLELKKPSGDKEAKILESLREKLKNVKPEINTHTVYKKDFPKKPYTQQEHEAAKTRVQGLIDRFSKEYEGVKLTPEEAEYWEANLKL